MTRLKLAWCSPLPPQRSGVADYTEELLPHVRELADIDLVIGRHHPVSRDLRRAFSIVHTDDLVAHAGAYDAVIYQIANSFHHHAFMFECLRSVPGIVVLHDYCLQYLMLGLTLGQGNLKALAQMLAPSHGQNAGPLARQLLFGSIDPETLSFARPVIERSRLTIVHSEYARECVRHDFPAQPVRVVPMGVPIERPPAPGSSSRARYGLREDDFIVASVTGLVFTKRLPLVLDAVRALTRRIPNLRVVIAGTGSPGRDARRSMTDLERAGILVRTGWVPAAEYRELIALADVVVDMRYPSGAETSASLARALAAGKPLIVSAHGASREIPDDCAIKIAVGPGEEDRLKDAIRDLAENGERRQSMARASKEFARASLRLECAARAYIDCVRDALSVDVPPPAETVWPSSAGSAASRLLVSSVYKVCRTRYILRNYGAGHALRRIRDELRTAAHPGTT
jgi:glycosyltransferase involved in cell wall biosynthesis